MEEIREEPSVELINNMLSNQSFMDLEELPEIEKIVKGGIPVGDLFYKKSEENILLN